MNDQERRTERLLRFFLAKNWTSGFSIEAQSNSKDSLSFCLTRQGLKTGRKYSHCPDYSASQAKEEMSDRLKLKKLVSLEVFALRSSKDSLSSRSTRQGLQTTDRRQGFSAFSSLKLKNWFLYWSAKQQGFSQPCSRDQARTTDYNQTARICCIPSHYLAWNRKSGVSIEM